MPPRRPAVLATAGGLLAVAAGVSLGLWSSGDGSAGDPSAAPTPDRAYPLSRAPRTVPAVRDFTPARGPGWRPASGERVVIADDRLADEGRLIADELGLEYAGKVGNGGNNEHGGNDRSEGLGGSAGLRDGDVELTLGGSGGSETYTLAVHDRRVKITGPGEAGVFYGTRTLKQAVHGGARAPEGTVRDGPAKQRRGLMLDIARKPYRAGWIEDRIREMGDLKLNELGLHFSDDQGFRIASDTHPEIVSAQHLSKDEVRRIVRLAESRHIAVVPELDSPGHLGAVLKAHPDLQLRTGDGRTAQGAVDIANPKAARLVDDLLKEYGKLFPGPYFHLGSDEYVALLSSDPEQTYPELAAEARRKYGRQGRIQDLTTAWLNARAATLRPTHHALRAWNDGFRTGGKVKPDRRLEVAYWTGREPGQRDPQSFLREGRKLIAYNDALLYYVLGEPGSFRYPTGQEIYERWNPRVARGTSAVPAGYDRQILGGSFAVWGDRPDAQTEAQVADGIFLPLRATAQKLWDPRRPSMSWQDFSALARQLGN